MTPLRAALLGLLALVTFSVIVTHDASASAPIAGNKCSLAVAPNVVGTDLGDNSIRADIRGTDFTGTCTGAFVEVKATTTNTAQFFCTQPIADLTGPGRPTTATIKVFADNDGYATVGATALFSRTVTLTGTTDDCLTGLAIGGTFLPCKSDGTAGGTTIYGLLRFQLRITRVVGITTIYDVNSETDPAPGVVTPNPTVGVWRCSPKVSTLDAGASPQNPWIGGDSISKRLAVSATSARTQNTANLRDTCNKQEIVGAAFQAGTSITSQSDTVQGSAATWNTGCTILINATLSATSAITVYSGTSYAIWDQTSPPSGVTFPSATVASFTSNVLNRILTEQSHCSPLVLTSPATVVNRGETVTSKCRWIDARSVVVPNSEFGRTWIQRTTQYRVSSDVGSSDTAFSGGTGELDASNVVTTTATVTTGTAYRFFAEEFDLTGRTDASLENWGNSTQQLDISATYTFDSLLNSKSAGGANVSSFTISADTEHAKALGLRDATGNPLNGVDIVCFRTRPDLVNEGNVDFGNTNSGGNTGDNALTVIAPAGTWKLTCTVTSNGNTGQYVISFFFTSAFSGDKIAPVLWNVTANGSSASDVNITMRLSFYDLASDGPACIYPDDLVRLTVLAFNKNSKDYDIILLNRTIMNPTIVPIGAFACDWNLILPAVPNSNLTDGVFAFVQYNFTGSPFLTAQGYILKNATGGGSMDIMGAVTTAADPYVAPVFWLVLILLFLWLRGWFPAVAAMLCLVDSMLGSLPTPVTVLGFNGRLMLFVLALFIHAIKKQVDEKLNSEDPKDQTNE